MITPDDLLDAVAVADVVVLAAASNQATAHVVDAEFLARMQDDAVLVNIARGSLIDETALLDSLDRGRPGMAVLDVFQSEPLPAVSPFWTHPRVRLTAHASGRGSATLARGDAVFLDNLRRYVAGEDLRLQVGIDALRESVQGNE
jgi:phosphoglycerate dehydrogenase-like enzyme